MPAVTPRIYASDEIEYFSFLRSLWFDHDLSFDNEYRHFYDAGIARSQVFRETFLELTTETGRRVNFGTIGCAILWAPFYAVGDAAARGLRAVGRDVAVDGFSYPYVAAVCYGSALYGFLSLLLSLQALRLLAPEAGAEPTASALLAGALAVWLGTPLLFYMYIAPPMSHACSAFAVALFVVAWLRVRRRWSTGGLAVLGLLAALMAMVREQDAFIAVGPAVDLAWQTMRRLKRGASAQLGEGAPRPGLVGLLVGGVAFAVGYAPQAVAYLVLNGHLGPSKFVARKMNWLAPHALQVLFSPEHGLFFWTPVAVLGIAGLVVAAATARNRTRVAAVCMLAMAAFQVYIAGSVESWTVAGAFGQRRFVGLSILLVIGGAALWHAARARAARAVLVAALLLAVWWNVGLTAQFGSGLMDRQRLEPARNAYISFVVIPRELPKLAYQYAFERSRFYRKGMMEREDRP